MPRDSRPPLPRYIQASQTFQEDDQRTSSSPSKTVSYFAVYFLPILLTVLLLLSVQAVDAEIKQLLPYRYFVRFPSGCSTADSLYLRTGGLPGRLSGLRLFFRHGDAVAVLGDTLVVCATDLVALSGETIGLKLRGACLQWNTSTCLVTVAVSLALRVLLGRCWA
jgi:hypothetical protein